MAKSSSNKRIEPHFRKNQKGRSVSTGKNSQSGRRSGNRRRGGSQFLRSISRMFYWVFVIGLWGGIASIAIVGFHAAQLPQSSSWAIPQRPPNVKILSVNGRAIANRGITGGEAVPLSQMSPYIPRALIAIEDRRFRHHFGIDPIGLARASFKNAINMRVVEGGSTITQQLAKNLFLKPERTFRRKVQEVVLALWLETKFSKDEILEIYLNRVYFGSGSYGVDAAARRYFNKSSRDVTLAQAALLAGVLKAPSRLSPARSSKRADRRAQIVLASMHRAGFITSREAATALSMPATKAKSFWSGAENYAADWIMSDLVNLIGKVEEDIIVDTTLDLGMQQNAELVIRDVLDRNRKLKVSQGALVSLDGTGAVRAMVGGGDYATSQFNRAIDAKRQPGSAFKPMVYLAALESGLTPNSVRQDAPVRIGKWRPKNYDGKYRGPVSLMTALAKSLNTIAAQLVMETGPANVVRVAQRLGIHSNLKANASIALGTSEVSLLELTAAYAPFANGGYLTRPYLVKRITTAAGKLLYQRKSPASDIVVRSPQLGQMNAMLSEVIRTGTGRAARIAKWQAGGKTGTSQNFRDSWFVGYTANLATGIWFGNDDGSPTKKVTGGLLPAKAWGRFMTLAHDGVPVADLPGHQAVVMTIPQNVPIPKAKPSIGRSRANRQLASHQDAHPVPPANVGETSRRGSKKSILDLIFGG